ncbi:MAG: RidA family protein [Acidobacteria bacterium]|nr:RidA family protein [Acidobacteriota bacterium]MCW5967272.1 RidA family protein [Blastocatellales bacterium]
MKNLILIVLGIAVGLTASLAFSGAAAQQRRNVNLPGRTSQAPFSDAVQVGNTLYLAGRLGTDPKTGQIPSDVEQEIRNILDAMKAVLAEAKMSMDDLVSVQVFCPDLTLYDKFNSVYRTYFDKNLPARAFIGSGPLLRGARFEIQAVAAR